MRCGHNRTELQASHSLELECDLSRNQSYWYLEQPFVFFWSVSVLFEEVVWIIGVAFPQKSGRQGKVEQASK